MNLLTATFALSRALISSTESPKQLTKLSQIESLTLMFISFWNAEHWKALALEG